MVKETTWQNSEVLDYDLEESEFELLSRNYIHFRTNPLRKSTNPFISPSMG